MAWRMKTARCAVYTLLPLFLFYLSRPHTCIQFREYLEQHGYDTSQMGLTETETDSMSSDTDEKKVPITA